MIEYFPKPKRLIRYIKFELSLSNYATKTDLKKQQVLIHWDLLKG